MFAYNLTESQVLSFLGPERRRRAPGGVQPAGAGRGAGGRLPRRPRGATEAEDRA